MDELAHLHDRERLLLSMHPSRAAFFSRLPTLIIEGIVIGIIADTIFTIILLFMGTALSLYFLALPPILLIAIMIWHGWHLWAHESFRVTTERILIETSGHFRMHPLFTIKWPQYQESWTMRAGLLDSLCGAKILGLRYGNADSQLRTYFPSNRWASDIKHYLDKADSAYRNQQIGPLQPFVFAKRGKRDAEFS